MFIIRSLMYTSTFFCSINTAIPSNMYCVIIHISETSYFPRFWKISGKLLSRTVMVWITWDGTVPGVCFINLFVAARCWSPDRSS